MTARIEVKLGHFYAGFHKDSVFRILVLILYSSDGILKFV
jgi:hypothetical protein